MLHMHGVLGALSGFPEPASSVAGTYHSAAADNMYHVSFGFICVWVQKHSHHLMSCLCFLSWSVVLWHFCQSLFLDLGLAQALVSLLPFCSSNSLKASTL